MRRIVITIAALLLAAVSGMGAAKAYWRSLPADQVPAMAANDAVVKLRASDKLYAEPKVFGRQARQIAAIAREVLRGAPLDALAMRQLGTAANLQTPGSGERQVLLAEQISRRDLPSEFMLINAAARQNDIGKTLSHYDHALSVHPGIGQKLFPILASELTAPEFRKALLPYAGKPWMRKFVVDAANYDVAPLRLMDFYAELTGKVPLADMQAGTILTISWLAATRQTAILGDMVNRMPGFAPGSFAPLGFDAVTSDARYKPVAWDLTNDGAISSGASGNRLTVEVAPDSTGFAAYRLMFLTPGQYQVGETISYDTGVPRARLTWQVTCVGQVSTVIANLALPYADASVQQAAALTVPPGCGAQAWRLNVAADQSQFASQAHIDGLVLRKM